MDARRKRIRRLQELREREVHRAVAELHRLQVLLTAAEEREREARSAIVEAEQERRALSSRASSPSEYTAWEGWLDSLSLKHGEALRALREAKLAAARQRAQVQQVRVAAKQIERLALRLQAREQAHDLKVERRLDDELARLATIFKE